MLWRWQPNVTDKKLGRRRGIRELDPEVGLARKKGACAKGTRQVRTSPRTRRKLNKAGADGMD